MKKLALVLLLVFAGVARPAARIPQNCWVANEPPGYCLWCAAETLGRHNRLLALHGLLQHRKECGEYEWAPELGRWMPDGSLGALCRQLDALRVKYRMQMPGNKGLALVQEAVDSGRGCVVGITDHSCGHAVVLLDLTDTSASCVDPNNTSAVRKMTRGEFDKSWQGFVLTLD